MHQYYVPTNTQPYTPTQKEYVVICPAENPTTPINTVSGQPVVGILETTARSTSTPRQQQASSQARGRVETKVSTPSHEVRSQANPSLDITLNAAGQADPGLDFTPHADHAQHAKSGLEKAAHASPSEKQLQPITEACALGQKVDKRQRSKPPPSQGGRPTSQHGKPPMLQARDEGQGGDPTCQHQKPPMLQARDERQVEAEPTTQTSTSKGLGQQPVDKINVLAEAEVHFTGGARKQARAKDRSQKTAMRLGWRRLISA